MFPIIDLRGQLNAINQTILKYHLRKSEITAWLEFYGDLIRPDEENEYFRGLPSGLFIHSFTLERTMAINAYIYETQFRFAVLKFKPSSLEIVIRRSMDNFWSEEGA